MSRIDSHTSDQRPSQPDDGASPRFRALARMDRRELDRLLRGGRVVTPAEVAGVEFRGWNQARASALLRVRKFLKRIHPPDPEGRVHGENVLARQGPISAPWRPRMGGRGILPFAVLASGAGKVGDRPPSLVISYGDWPGRRRWNPVARVADYVIRPFPHEFVLLGESRLRMGSGRVFLEHFLLEPA